VLEVADGGMVAGPSRGCARGETTTGWVGARGERTTEQRGHSWRLRSITFVNLIVYKYIRCYLCM